MAEESNYFSNLGSGGFASDATSAGLSFLGGVAGNYVGGLLGSHFGQKNAKKDAKRSFNSYVKQALFDYNMAKGPYFDLSKKYDEKNYDLARRYSENSALWARRGLENAGLNPVLAASQGFNANMGFQGQQVDSPSPSMPSFRSSNAVNSIGGDFSGVVRDMASARLSESTAALNRANMDVSEASAAKILVEAITTAKRHGLTGNLGGLFGMLNSTLSEFTGSTGSKMLDAVLDKATSNLDKVTPPNLTQSQRREWKKKAGRFLSDIIKKENSRRIRYDGFKNMVSPSYDEGFRANPLLIGH